MSKSPSRTPGASTQNPASGSRAPARTLREIRVAPRRVLLATPVFDTYWRFAVERQNLFVRRHRGESAPWTTDPVLSAHRFTNVYRASDRVSQYLIRNVLYDGPQSPEETFFRALLFKLFNKIETWELFVEAFGKPTWRRFNLDAYANVLDREMSAGRRLYSAAYIMPSPQFGHLRKHRNHLALLKSMMADGAPKKVATARSLADVFNTLVSYPSLGPFLAFQFAIDLNYSTMIDFSEMDFVVAGPGARDGMRKCFADVGGLSDADVIRAVTERAPEEFRRLGLHFTTLHGRPLHLIDCQNLFCEVDKYARVVHPEWQGESGRTRIKQRFESRGALAAQFYPPKWGLECQSRQDVAANKKGSEPQRAAKLPAQPSSLMNSPP